MNKFFFLLPSVKFDLLIFIKDGHDKKSTGKCLNECEYIVKLNLLNECYLRIN